MKKILLLFAIVLIGTACSEDFLDRYPKGRWHHGNYTPDNTLDKGILVEAKLAQAYGTLRGWPFCWANFGMNNYTTPDVEKGSTPSDGGDITQFKSLSFTASNAPIADYYSACYNSIFLTNEALALISALEDAEAVKNTYLAEALFLRSVMYYRLTQAFGGVPFVDKVLGQNEKTPARSTRVEIWQKIERDLKVAIPFLPTRKALLTSDNEGRATQNAARAILAKVYLYQKNWSASLDLTTAIIASGDNSLNTPYDQIFTEATEYGDESVFEVYADEKPVEQIYMGSQFAQIQGIRGIPNLGWGFNAPSQILMDAYEAGDPRKAASVIADGDVLDGKKVRADAAGYKFFNKKAYTKASERGLYGRPAEAQGTWVNIRVIRYADVVLMHAEAACELGNANEALAKLEMIRSRARGADNALLPKITTTDIGELRAKIHQERRIELAMEWERFYDLIRWGEAKSVIPNFVTGKHELFPIPQTEIDKSEGILTQNPGY
ncbi:MAG TPA: RagB/SusD family nutrient uptake outer membrane protein [Prolixibacteraceae bacterium]|nr:RagB/SusD family nutrient uptake outer membrane protein [Prolixibacteraceae bacterium]